MQTAKLFQNGQSQAVRLPKAFRFDGDEVVIKRIGDAVLLLPKRYSVDSLASLLADIDEPVNVQREQPEDLEDRDVNLT